MLDGDEHITCECNSDGHTLRFILDKEDKQIYVTHFLQTARNPFKRMWVALKYVLGYKSVYGHFGETILGMDKLERISSMINKLRNDQ